MLPRFDRPDKRRSDRQEKTLQLHFATRSRRAPSRYVARATPVRVISETFRQLTPGERHTMKRLMILNGPNLNRWEYVSRTSTRPPLSPRLRRAARTTRRASASTAPSVSRIRPALFADWNLTATSQRCTRSPRWRKNPARSRFEIRPTKSVSFLSLALAGPFRGATRRGIRVTDAAPCYAQPAIAKLTVKKIVNVNLYK